MVENYFEDEYSEMWIEGGIGMQVYKPKLILTLNVAEKIVWDRLIMFNGVARPMFVDIRNLSYAEPAARKYLASEEAGQLVVAGAIYLKNPVTRIFGNFFMMIDVPTVPAMLFTDKSKALDWLKEFIQ